MNTLKARIFKLENQATQENSKHVIFLAEVEELVINNDLPVMVVPIFKDCEATAIKLQDKLCAVHD